jgi:hypothetical protein
VNTPEPHLLSDLENAGPKREIKSKVSFAVYVFVLIDTKKKPHSNQLKLEHKFYKQYYGLVMTAVRSELTDMIFNE